MRVPSHAAAEIATHALSVSPHAGEGALRPHGRTHALHCRTVALQYAWYVEGALTALVRVLHRHVSP